MCVPALGVCSSPQEGLQSRGMDIGSKTMYPHPLYKLRKSPKSIRSLRLL